MPDAVNRMPDLPSFLGCTGVDADSHGFEQFRLKMMVFEIFLSPQNRKSESRSEFGKAAVVGRVAS